MTSDEIRPAPEQPSPVTPLLEVHDLRVSYPAREGGRTEVVRTSSDLQGATARIAEELNSQYVLGYTSPRGADGQFHSIRVKVGAGYLVRSRTGYIATPLARRRS